MFRFANPEYLYGLYSLPLIIFAFWYLTRNKYRLLDKFADKKLQPILLPVFSKVKEITRFGLIILAIAFLILAAADPQVGTKIENVKETGIDIYILLDVSLSMQAQDIKPSRLEKAKLEISNLIQKLEGDRIGLIVFAGEPFIQFPLTSDYSAANLFLSAADVNTVPDQGTAIAAAINLATKSFDHSSKTERVAVIFTDGEDHEGNLQDAIDEAKRENITIYTIGLGSPNGVPIPVYNGQGQQTGFKADINGNIVLTKLDEAALKDIADGTGGQYLRGANDRDELDLIYQNLSKIKKTEFGEKKITDYEDRFYYFLSPALILLLMEFFMVERKSRIFGVLSKKLGLE
ncbi:MAG TPA: VWA domain-containing protein [Candidatus Acidoferrales bacterium]|nr:VWA domain-containing protein [Candidatus Acidoferrales bacterium]